jgi:hypothetical protein
MLKKLNFIPDIGKNTIVVKIQNAGWISIPKTHCKNTRNPDPNLSASFALVLSISFWLLVGTKELMTK